MGTRKMGPVDAIWLNMDRPDNLMVIDSLIFLDGEADWDRLVERTRSHLVDRYPVFRQRPVLPRTHVGTPHWEDDPDFDADRHLVRATLDGDDDAAVQRYVAGLMHQALDREHPLWQMHLLEGHAAGAVVYTRLHHALADGIALARVLLDLTTDTPEGDLAGEDDAEVHDPEMGVVEGAFQVATAAGSAAAALVGAGLDLVRGAPRLLAPHHVGDAFTQMERTVGIADKLLLGPRPDTPFSDHPARRKLVAWAAPVPLERVKQVARAADATVNDVAVAAVAGTLATYVRERGGTVTDVATMVPVNVRPLDRPLPRHLGNQFALVLLNLPLSVEDPLERIAETKRRMDAIKHSPEVFLTFGLIKAIGRTGQEVERFFVDFFANKAIGVTTNVPGPAEPRYLAGSRIRRILSWPPENGDQTLGVSIFSYAGSLQVGFRADATNVPDPDRLVAAFEAQVTDLARLVAAR